jgi:hypothetical protein
MAALAVATLYYLWRSRCQTLLRRQRVLCQRVAYMLWVMAERVQNGDSGLWRWSESRVD